MLPQITNSFSVLISRLSISEKRICELEDGLLDISQTEKKVDKKNKRQTKTKKNRTEHLRVQGQHKMVYYT